VSVVIVGTQGGAELLEKLKSLEDLQKVDVELLELERGGSEHPKKLAALEAELAAAQSAVDVEQTRLAEVERSKRTLEDQISADKEKLKKWEARLAEQRSTREYSALAREIDIARKQTVTLQDEVLTLSKQVEDLGNVVAEKQLELDEKAKDLGEQARAARAAMAEIDGRRQELLARRAKAAEKVDPVMLRRYEVVRSRRGTVLAPIVNGACKGCNMNIPPQLYNELRTSQRLDVCPSCGRMIYAAEAFEPPEDSARP
jgi:predicted  nucleic acid-binding Zn-ribbon protein